ncbi:protein translocase subunit SecF [Candidatus Oleimmundimicrobium sp.]|uniref:protein translocase subunit SecF n=1 Tax=Candidatus Oleimmundimicrobium sp. TaxID=3060597 RepID=UPI00271C185E|nr:protein translocase subunit SecF [Candidatus Oleimmundimicrobium sp.]MDO8886718.1 protein translocase subunit SecF [Candidatus Oleimmundimicrobium sp.]
MMKLNLMGRKKVWFTLSGIVISISVIAVLILGIKPGIDFKGGTFLDIKFEKTTTVSNVRDVLRKYDLADSVIQHSEENEFLIRSKRIEQKTQGEILKDFEKNFGIKEVRDIQNVGPGWGAQVTKGAFLALVASLITILIYISLRFEYKMAFSAVAALFHDVIIAVGLYALFGREVTPNTIAGLLTILGYSLYDTIVVFHRIRENTKYLGRKRYSDMVNDSVNQVFMRSINTSLTSLLPVICLLMFGGETLKDFALILAIGLIAGTYSSIFIASPILAIWKEREPKYRPSKA